MIFHAITQSDLRKVEILLEAGADVNRRSWNGTTPAMAAGLIGRFDIVHLLLESGADASIKDSAGKSLWDVIAYKKGRALSDSSQDIWMEKVIAVLLSKDAF